MNEQELFDVLQRLFSDFNIDCCDNDQICGIYEDIDNAVGTNLEGIYRAEYMEEEDED